MLAWLVMTATALAGSLELDLGGHLYHPVWSEDGRDLVVEVNRHKDHTRLVVVTLGGEGQVEGTRDVVLPGARNPFSGGEPVAMGPTWVGEAFLFEGTDAAGRFRIYRADREGRAEQVVGPAALGGNLTFPSATEGGPLALVGDATGGGQLYLVEGGEARPLTQTPVPEMFPILSADGARLAFSRNVGGTEDLFTLDLRTGKERQVAGGAGDQTRPVWVGEALLFFDEQRSPGRWDVVWIGADGTRRVLGRDARLPLRGRPAVSGDGVWVAYATEGGEGVVLASVDGARRVQVPVAHQQVGDPALGMRDGRMWLAYTGLPAGDAGWRQLVVEDVTERLKAPGAAR